MCQRTLKLRQSTLKYDKVLKITSKCSKVFCFEDGSQKQNKSVLLLGHHSHNRTKVLFLGIIPITEQKCSVFEKF
jgi:hypothetical protein